MSCALSSSLLFIIVASKVTLSAVVNNDLVCGPNQFKCLQLNLNQILTIHQFNKRPRECIPLSSLCDGRHDCQDGSDEVECRIDMPRKKKFKCFVGNDTDYEVEDCTERDKKYPVTNYHEKSRSVSEMKEWVCSKLDKPDGSVIRDCMRLYTGGEKFRVCYTSIYEGSTCLCSRELCNTAALPSSARPILMLFTLHLMATHNFLLLLQDTNS